MLISEDNERWRLKSTIKSKYLKNICILLICQKVRVISDCVYLTVNKHPIDLVESVKKNQPTSKAWETLKLPRNQYFLSFYAEAWLAEFWALLTSVWDECNCVVVWAFFGIAFLWDWNENWPFPVLWPLLSFPNLLAYWVQHFHSIIFQELK